MVAQPAGAGIWPPQLVVMEVTGTAAMALGPKLAYVSALNWRLQVLSEGQTARVRAGVSHGRACRKQARQLHGQGLELPCHARWHGPETEVAKLMTALVRG